MRLDKFLSDCGVGTRSQVKKDIRDGRVCVNGEICRSPETKISPESDTVSFQGRTLGYRGFEYYMLNKPAGCVCAARDNLHSTIFDWIPMNPRKDLAAVGRLDLETEGLLLVTNDGALSHRLLSPRHHVDKLYEARVSGRLAEEDIAAFARGIDIGDEKPTLPAELVITVSGEESLCRVTIHEGRYHQIKRMFHSLGKEVLWLKRLQMGTFVLDEKLAPGEWRRLDERELEDVEKYKGGHL